MPTAPHVYAPHIKSGCSQTYTGCGLGAQRRAYPFLRPTLPLPEEAAGRPPDGRTHFCAASPVFPRSIRVPVSAANGSALTGRGRAQITVPVSASPKKKPHTVPVSASVGGTGIADRPADPLEPYLILRTPGLCPAARAYPFLRLAPVPGRRHDANPYPILRTRTRAVRTRFCVRRGKSCRAKPLWRDIHQGRKGGKGRGREGQTGIGEPRQGRGGLARWPCHKSKKPRTRRGFQRLLAGRRGARGLTAG